MSVSVNRRVDNTASPFTGTGTGATYKYRKRKGHDIIRYSLNADDGGSFTATVKLEVSNPDAGDWVDVPSGSFTAETSGTFVPGNDCDLRWNCTAWTSGNIIGTIS